MESGEILASLAKLEASLDEIESAKEQVRQTVEAYASVQVQIDAYTKTLDDMGRSLKSIIEEIKSQRTSLDDDALNILATFRAKVDEIVSVQDSSATKIIESLKSTFNAAKDSFINNFSDITDSLKKDTDEEVKKLDERVKDLKACAANLNSLHESIKSALDKIVDVEQDIRDLKRAMLKTQGEQDALLAEIRAGVSSLSLQLDRTAEEISNNIQINGKELNKAAVLMSEKTAKIENKGMRLEKFSIVIIILTAVNVLIGFCSVAVYLIR